MNKLKNRILIGCAILIVALNIALLIWNQSLKASSIPYLANTPIDRIAIDTQGRVWVSENGKLSVYQDGIPTQVFTKEDSPALAYPTWLLEIDNQERAWVDSWNQKSQKSELAVFDGTKLLALPTIPEPVLTQILKSGITSIAFDTQGRAWIGTDTQGLYIITGESWENYTSNNSGLLGNIVTCISFDNQGRAWIGSWGKTTRAGINIFDGSTWQSFTAKNSPQFRLRISAIAFDLKGQAWIASNGIYTYDGEHWEKILETDDGFVDIAIDAKGRVWALRMFDRGLIEINGKSWKNHRFSIGRDFGGDLATDGNGNIWIPTQNGVAIISSNLRRPSSSLTDMISFAIASNSVIYLDICLIGIWLYFGTRVWRSAGWSLTDLQRKLAIIIERKLPMLVLGVIVIFLGLTLIFQSYFLWPDYFIGRIIIWIPIFGLAGLFFVWLWRLTSKIQRKYVRRISKIILGLFIALATTLLAGVFFLTCLGIGPAGCY